LVDVSYHAQEQFKRLSPKERTDLTRLLSQNESLVHTNQVGESGRFVSRFGNNKRVLWKKSDDGTVVVLSVVAQSN
jgi:hypothetical protein